MRISDWSSDVCSSDLHADRANTLRRNPEQPVRWHIQLRSHELEVDDVAGGKDETGHHAGDRAGGIGALVEDAEHDCREKRGGRQTKREGHHLRHESRWIDAERSEEHTSELQSLMRTSYAVFCLKKKKHNQEQ